jgi:hypothetical protein
VCPFRLPFAACAALLALAARADDTTLSPIDAGLLERQPALIDTQVARISHHAAAGPQAYFLGFAGVGDERVFAQEIDLAARRFADRYGVGDRSLRLVNDQRDLHKYPLASTGGLRYALNALGRIMDDDDVLFLALASHGMRNGKLVVSNAGLRMPDLDARKLAGMLRDAGIRWRVIVISACYSGRFIKPLADNHTVVITASSRSRPSFGCGVERDLTFFGEAFYRDAMAGARTLRGAFEIARRTITTREQEEGVWPSNPQSYFGPMMESKLDEMIAGDTPPPVTAVR